MEPEEMTAVPEIRPSTYTVPLYRRSPLERARYAQRELRAAEAMIRIMSDARREAVVELTETTAMTYREIAAELGISEPQVSRIAGKGWRKPAGEG